MEFGSFVKWVSSEEESDEVRNEHSPLPISNEEYLYMSL
jgi:hypothetical protein